MKKQIKWLEIISFFICAIVGIFVFLGSSYISEVNLHKIESAIAYNEYLGENISYLLQLILLVCLPAFLSVCIALIFTTWRYKIVIGVLLLFALIALAVEDMVLSSTVGLMPLVGSLIRLSCSMTSALTAVFIWKYFKDKHQIKTRTVEKSVGLSEKKIQRTSLFLLCLSLISIPLIYITIFVSTFVSLGFSALLLVGLLQLPQIPLVILLAAILAPLAAGWATIRALRVILFAKPAPQPAHVINLTNYPKLNDIINDVCHKVHTKLPDNIIIHVEPNFYVSQGKINTYDGVVSGRTLSLGVPVVNELTVSELKSILAHEFAHFSGHDTLYSTFVSPVYNGLQTAVINLSPEDSGDESITTRLIEIILLPSFLFLSVCHEYFSTIDSILSRNRELRADFISASHYGSDSFKNALKKVIQFGSCYDEFHQYVSFDDERSFFMQFKEFTVQNSQKIKRKLEEILQEQELEFDSHPSVKTRINYLPETSERIEKENDNILEELRGEEEKLSEYYIRFVKPIFYSSYEHMGCFEEFEPIVSELSPKEATTYNSKGVEFLTPDSSGLITFENIKKAITAFDKAIEINPANEEVYFNKGLALYIENRYDEAIAAFDKVIELNPENVDAYNKKGSALFFSGRFMAASEAFDRAITVNPESVEGYINKANALDVSGDREEALLLYDKALSVAPENGFVYWNKGIVLRNLGRDKDAEIAFEKAKPIIRQRLLDANI